MPRVLKTEIEAEHRRRVSALAENFRVTPQPLGTASACALAALCIRWDVGPDEAMRRALLGAAICAGALPGRDVKAGQR